MLNTKHIGKALALTYLLNVFDMLATLHWVQILGSAVEGNPFMELGLDSGFFFIYKLGVVAALLFMLYMVAPRLKKLLFIYWVLPIVYTGLTVYHIYLLGVGVA